MLKRWNFLKTGFYEGIKHCLHPLQHPRMASFTGSNKRGIRKLVTRRAPCHYLHLLGGVKWAVVVSALKFRRVPGQMLDTQRQASSTISNRRLVLQDEKVIRVLVAKVIERVKWLQSPD